MVNIFLYTNFQQYLQLYYDENKKLHPSYFSYQWLAEKAGFANRGFIYNIINKTGTKLSTTNCIKLSEALNHNKKEALHFTYLVAYAQEKDDEERNRLIKLIAENARVATTEMIRRDQKAYLSQWYHSVIRSLIGIFPFRGDYIQLSRMLCPSITPEQAKESVELLERLLIIKHTNDGTYERNTQKVITGSEFTQAEKDRYHLDCLKVSRDVLQQHFPGEMVRSFTFAVSEKTRDLIQKELLDLLQVIQKFIDDDEGAERVFLYQSFLVPVTKPRS